MESRSFFFVSEGVFLREFAGKRSSRAQGQAAIRALTDVNYKLTVVVCKNFPVSIQLLHVIVRILLRKVMDACGDGDNREGHPAMDGVAVRCAGKGGDCGSWEGSWLCMLECKGW